MSTNDGTTSPTGATPNGSEGGAMPPTPSAATGAMPTPPTPAPGTDGRDAPGGSGANGEEGRDAHLPEGARRALQAERQKSADLEKEVTRLRSAEQKRADAEKSELQLAQERAEAAEAKAANLEREALSRSVAAEFGIAQWWDTLQGDDLRTLRASAQRLRERLGMPQGSMDGGVRGSGTPGQVPDMDALIRAGARR